MSKDNRDIIRRDYDIFDTTNTKVGHYYLLFNYDDIKQMKKVMVIEKKFLQSLKKKKFTYTSKDTLVKEENNDEQ